jgi:Fur family peroxide stress response transcriptional regulator
MYNDIVMITKMKQFQSRRRERFRMPTINKLRDYLLDKGVKPSYSRLKVLEYMLKYRNHPTVDDIYHELLREIPTLSRTTIYNTINLFVNENIAVPISIDPNETRYDATVAEHGHFKCNRCGRIEDFPIHLESYQPKELDGFKVLSRDVYYKGLCPSCINYE